VKESAFQGWVVDLFKQHGWDVKHAPTPMRPIAGGKFVPDPRGRGLLDLLMTHEDPPRIVFAECKGHGGELSDDQRDMLRRLRLVADEVKEIIEERDPDLHPRIGAAPLGVFVFQPGNEELIEAIARGADA
jgi:hypothetical protein